MISQPQKYKKIRNNIEQPQIQSQKEQFVLKISLCCAVILAIFGITYGIYIGSKAIIFDGLVAFLSTILILLSVMTSKFIYKEDDDIFQYGYMRFELAEKPIRVFRQFLPLSKESRSAEPMGKFVL